MLQFFVINNKWEVGNEKSSKRELFFLIFVVVVVIVVVICPNVLSSFITNILSIVAIVVVVIVIVIIVIFWNSFRSFYHFFGNLNVDLISLELGVVEFVKSFLGTVFIGKVNESEGDISSSVFFNFDIDNFSNLRKVFFDSILINFK